MEPISISGEAPDGPLATSLLQRYYDELAARFPGGFDAGDAASSLAMDLTPPRGAFLVARLDGRGVGCGGVRMLDDTGAAEVKRMWVDPSMRGRGVGRHLLAALEEHAAELGADVVRLDTSAHLDEALGLYRSSGYREVPAYNDNPYAAHWFEKSLA